MAAPGAAASSLASSWLSASPALEVVTDAFEPGDATDSSRSRGKGRLAGLLERFALRRSTAAHVQPELPAGQLLEEPPEESLFYLTGEGRLGPLPLSGIYQMIADGELAMETPVSMKGTTDWLTFSEYLKTRKAGKGSEAKGALSGMAWGLALAPAWGAVIPLAATQASVALGYPPLAYQLQIWSVVLVMNIALCFLDYRSLKRGGRDLGVTGALLSLLVPLYLCRRERTLPAKALSLLLWTISAAISVGGFLVVSTANVPVFTVIERMIHG